MKRVYTTQKINRSLPRNVFGRLFLGTTLGASGILLAVASVEAVTLKAALFAMFGGVGAVITAFWVIFFAIRTIIAIRSTRTRTPEETLIFDESKPYYSGCCPGCGVMIDYQRSDLAYRLWFLKGYVECPCCGKPIRHDAEKNYFIPHRYYESR